MPMEAQELMGEGVTLYDVCTLIHQHNTGASDPLKLSEYNRLFKILCTAVKHWHHGKGWWNDYDDCVLKLVKETIVESCVFGSKVFTPEDWG